VRRRTDPTHSRSNVDLEHEEVTTLEGLQLLPGPTEAQTEAKNNFVMPPFAVSHSSVCGALQIEGVAEFEEPDLFFIDAVVSQLAIALDRDATDQALPLFALQLILNAVWSWLFFRLHDGAIAFVDIVLLWIVIVTTLALFWRVDRIAGVLFAPYLLWVSFALCLNLSVWRLNPKLL
jgi:hypothetical protein